MKKRSNEEKTDIPLCTKCLFCKSMKGLVYCSKRYFKPTTIDKAVSYVPQNFDCWEYEEM